MFFYCIFLLKSKKYFYFKMLNSFNKYFKDKNSKINLIYYNDNEMFFEKIFKKITTVMNG